MCYWELPILQDLQKYKKTISKILNDTVSYFHLVFRHMQLSRFELCDQRVGVYAN